jgi:hypothetical protein
MSIGGISGSQALHGSGKVLTKARFVLHSGDGCGGTRNKHGSDPVAYLAVFHRFNEVVRDVNDVVIAASTNFYLFRVDHRPDCAPKGAESEGALGSSLNEHGILKQGSEGEKTSGPPEAPQVRSIGEKIPVRKPWFNHPR